MNQPEPAPSFIPLMIRQMQDHKWLESEKARRDLGAAAYDDWSQRFSLAFVSARFREHQRGDRRWREFEE